MAAIHLLCVISICQQQLVHFVPARYTVINCNLKRPNFAFIRQHRTESLFFEKSVSVIGVAAIKVLLSKSH